MNDNQYISTITSVDENGEPITYIIKDQEARDAIALLQGLGEMIIDCGGAPIVIEEE